MMGNFLVNFEKPHSNVKKTAVATFWTTFVNIWATFYSTSGHTAGTTFKLVFFEAKYYFRK